MADDVADDAVRHRLTDHADRVDEKQQRRIEPPALLASGLDALGGQNRVERPPPVTDEIRQKPDIPLDSD